MTTQENITHNKLGLDIGAVFARTNKRFEKVFLPVLLLQIASLAIMFFALVIVAAIIGGLYALLPAGITTIALLSILGLMMVGLGAWIYCAVPIMTIHILQNPSYEYAVLFKKSIKQVPRVFTIVALTSLAIIGGLILGFLPGIWLAIVLEFVLIILVLEHKNHKEVIAQSAFLVKGNFWNVAIALTILIVVSMFVGAIPFVGILLGVIIAIFGKCLTFELYKTLTHNKVHDTSVKHTNKKLVNGVYALAAFAVLAIIAIVTTLILLVGLANLEDGARGEFNPLNNSVMSEPEI